MLFQGDWENALQEFQIAHDFSNDPAIQSSALIGIGRSYFQAKNFYEAANRFEEAIQSYPQSPHLAQAYFLLGQAYSNMGQYSDAAQAYLQYLAMRPGVIDSYVLDLRGDALFAGGDYAGAANDYQAAVNTPSLLDETLLRMKMARAYAVSGDYATAITLYDDIYSRSNDDNTRALIALRKGQAYLGLGQTDQAMASFLDGVNNFPVSYDSYNALIALVEAGISVDELQRGVVDFYAGQYGVALAALDRYLQNNPADPGSAYYFYGLTQRALGEYEAALQAWNQVIQNYPEHPYWDRAWEQKAYTQWFHMDQSNQGIETLLAFVDRVPTHTRAGEFLYDAAQVSAQSGKLEQAAELYERVINLYPAYELSQQAIFLSGISRYRMQDYSGALTSFIRYQEQTGTLEDKARAYLWIAKTQAGLGDTEAEQNALQQAASIDPTGYYSERARDLLHDRPPFDPPVAYDIGFDLASERLKAEEWIKSAFGLDQNLDLSGLGPLGGDPHLQRGSELWQLGLYEEARNEFEALRQSLSTDAAGLYRLTNYMLELGLYRSSILAARQILELALMNDAETMGAPAYFNHVRFGPYFSDLIIPTAETNGFHPLFLFSVVRQESLFEGFIRSAASASGLMQIMPTTGDDIHQDLGWPENYSSEDLNRPLVSITFGADYLVKQLNLFDGDLYMALAAYNGGPGNALAWRELAQGDPDLFLEIINYEETRKYIRSIYEVFNIYRWLYDRSP